MQAKNLLIFETLSSGFSNLIHKVIFVGGACLSLYITDEAAPECHPSNDVDAVLDVSSVGEYIAFEKELIKRNFTKHPQPNGPDRWAYQGIEIYLTPLYAEPNGYYNRWYEEGAFHAKSYRLPNGIPIRIFNPAYYVAARIDAFHNLGSADPRRSVDFQDLIYLMDNRTEIVDDITHAFYGVRTYIQEEFRRLLNRNDFEEGIVYALPDGFGEESILKIRDIMIEVMDFQPRLVKT